MLIRMFKGDAGTPARFWPVAWAENTEELQELLDDGYVVDQQNLFGPDGKYPSEVPSGS